MFLRLRKAARKRGLRVVSIAPFATRGLTKMAGRLIAHRTRAAKRPPSTAWPTRPLLAQPGAIILVGERLATSPAPCRRRPGWPRRTGARLAWVPAAGRRPRRAGGRRAAQPAARRPPGRGRRGAPTARRAWDVDEPARRDPAATPPPSSPRRPTGDSVRCSIGGVDPADLPDPRRRLAAIEAAPFVVSLELRRDRGHRAAPTSSSRSRRWRRRPARSSTGRAGSAPFEPSLPSQRLPPICGCCTSSPTSSASTSASDTAGGRAPSSPRSAAWDGARAAAPSVAAGERRSAGQGRGGAGRLANAAGPRPATGR